MLRKLLLFPSWNISPWHLSPDSIVQHDMKLSDRLVCCRCPDPSLQPIFSSLWVGGRPGGAFGLFVGAQPGVPSLRWSRLGLPLRSPRLRGLQGEREIRERKLHCETMAMTKLTDWSETSSVVSYWHIPESCSHFFLCLSIVLSIFVSCILSKSPLK